MGFLGGREQGWVQPPDPNPAPEGSRLLRRDKQSPQKLCQGLHRHHGVTTGGAEPQR